MMKATLSPMMNSQTILCSPLHSLQLDLESLFPNTVTNLILLKDLWVSLGKLTLWSKAILPPVLLRDWCSQAAPARPSEESLWKEVAPPQRRTRDLRLFKNKRLKKMLRITPLEVTSLTTRTSRVSSRLTKALTTCGPTIFNFSE